MRWSYFITGLCVCAVILHTGHCVVNALLYVEVCQCPSAAAGGGICSGITGGGGLHPGAALFPWLLPAVGAQIISGRDGAASSPIPATLIPTPGSPLSLTPVPFGRPCRCPPY